MALLKLSSSRRRVVRLAGMCVYSLRCLVPSLRQVRVSWKMAIIALAILRKSHDRDDDVEVAKCKSSKQD